MRPAEALYRTLLYRHVAHDFFADDLKTEHLPASDILLHLPVLEWLARQCSVIVEFGVRDGHSTAAFLTGLNHRCGSAGKLYSYDLETPSCLNSLAQEIAEGRWVFQHLNTVEERTADRVPECDLLFVDTLHTYDQVRRELQLHGHKTKRYLVFHDTTTCGERDLSGPDPRARGIRDAVDEFVRSSRWKSVYCSAACNGLEVYEFCGF